MTDRELLELAAKAAGLLGLGLSYDEKYNWLTDHEQFTFSPLDDDGDALRLANKLRINIQRETLMTDPTFPPSVHCGQCGLTPCEWAEEPEGEDADRATRRAITRAAAEIGKAMP